MNDIELKFRELRGLMGKTDESSVSRRDEISLWIKENSDNKEVAKAYDQFMESGLSEIESDIKGIRMQIDSNYELLPISYIAKHYFGKSRAWLYQRINGNKIRGKVYTLNDEQKCIFNSAVQDIAKRIGSVQLS